MYHSVTYGEKNTWEDWHLIPKSRPLFNPPEVKTNYVDIPGANGSLDLSEVLTGYPVYENRTGSHEYYVMNGYQPWDVLYSEIMNYLHGKRLVATLEDDPSSYYEGRFSVNSWKSDRNWSSIVIDYEVYPYKRDFETSVDDWLWDPFDFETGIINETNNLTVSGSLTITVIGKGEPVVPVITVTTPDESGMEVTFKGTDYNLTDGENLNPNIMIVSGENTITFTGNGTVSLTYRGGSL